VLAQDMTISRESFLRALPAAVNHSPFTTAGAEVRPVDAGLGWRIVVTPLPDLRLGLIVLPAIGSRCIFAVSTTRASGHFSTASNFTSVGRAADRALGRVWARAATAPRHGQGFTPGRIGA